MNFLKEKLNLYYFIILAIIAPTKCSRLLNENNNLIRDFRRIHLEALIATIVALFMGYLLAGFPKQIVWHKIIPTLLIAYPVYSNNTADLETWSGDTKVEKMDKLLFKTIYLVGITWLAWGIFKGLI